MVFLCLILSALLNCHWFNFSFTKKKKMHKNPQELKYVLVLPGILAIFIQLWNSFMRGSRNHPTLKIRVCPLLQPSFPTMQQLV